MCKIYGKRPDDPWFEELDPILRLYMYESWYADLEDKNEFAKSYAILQGSFANPEMARKMVKLDNPDFESSDEDFDKVSKSIIEKNRQELKEASKLKRRKRKLLTNRNATNG